MTSRDLRRALSTAVVAVPVMTIVGWILGLPAWSQADPPPNALVGAAWGAVIGVVLSLLSAFVAAVRDSLWAAPPAGEESAAYRTEQRAVRDAVVRTFPTALTVLAVAAGISALSPAIVGRLAPAVGVVVVIVLFRARVAGNRKDLSLDE